MNEREIFTAALRKPAGAERQAYLVEVCGDDAQLRRSVEALLDAHDQTGPFLESALGPVFARTILNEQISERPGTTIGPYRLLEQIGEGGFGVVFMAEQSEPVRRKVALKVIKPGMDTRQVIARFEAERQALALMDHPHIARVLDAGATESGRPFFVMELVKGIPITQFCDQNQLNIRERLELFVSVCQAAQHAHQKGIIHRDIKPSNVLVTLHDDRPVVKVIDFGVAKATSGHLTDKTLFTGFLQMLGTPLYMSPEQTALSSVDIDTRSDIYSLGVLLYELLTGTTPFDRQRLESAAIDEIRRIIREEEPNKPSTRMSTLGDSLPSLAVQRRTEPKKLRQLLRGDLDWIVMKALEKDRARRYETANGFARDIQRYLADEAIEARPPSTAYRFQKAVRRNKVALTTVGLVTIALIVGTAVSTWQAVRAKRAESAAESALVDVRTERDRAVKAEQRAHESLQAETTARHDAQQNLAHALGAVEEFFTLVSQDKLFDQPSLQPLRLDLLEAAVRYYEAMLQQRGNDPALLADLAVARLRIAPVYAGFDRQDDAIGTLAAGLEDVERLRRDFPQLKLLQLKLAGFWRGVRGTTQSTPPRDTEKADQTLHRLYIVWDDLSREHPQTVEFRSDLAGVCYALSMWQLELGHNTGDDALIAKGFETANRGMQLWEQLCHDHPDTPEYPDNLIESLKDAAYWNDRSSRNQAGEELRERAKQLTSDAIERFPHHAQFRSVQLEAVHHDGKRLESGQRFGEADEKFRQAHLLAERLAEDFPGVPQHSYYVCRACMNLIRIAPHVGRSAEDVEALRKRIVAELANLQRLSRDVFDSPDEQRQYARALFDIGSFLNDSGDRTASTEAFRLCLDARKNLAALFPESSVDRLDMIHSARVLGGRLSGEASCDAISDAERALVRLCDRDPENSEYRRLLISTRCLLAESLRADERRGEADEKLALVLSDYDRLPVDDPERALVGSEFANAANGIAWGLVSKSDVSQEDAQWSVALIARAVEFVPHSRDLWNTLGVALCRTGDWPAAERALRKVMQLYDGGSAWTWYFLAMADWQQGEAERARHWYDAAEFWMAKYDRDNHDLLRFRAELQTLLSAPHDPLPAHIDDAAIAQALCAADPGLECYWTIKGRVDAAIRDWKWGGATADVLRAAALKPEDDFLQFQVATLLARAGDEAAYRQQCRKLLERHGQTTDPVWAERTAKACLLLPASGEDLKAACRLAEASVTLDENHWVIPFSHVAAALAAYRRGKHQDCIDWCDRALAHTDAQLWFRIAQAHYLRALAHAALEDRPSATREFRE